MKAVIDQGSDTFDLGDQPNVPKELRRDGWSELKEIIDEQKFNLRLISLLNPKRKCNKFMCKVIEVLKG